MSLEIFVISILAAFVIFEVIRMAWRIRIAKQKGRKAEGWERERRGSGARILVIGDSTALGAGATTFNTTIGGQIASEFKNAHVVNMAENAIPAQKLASKLRDITSSDHDYFDIVIIQIGGIDVLSFTTVRHFAHHLKESLKYAKKICRGSIILVSPGNIGALPLFRFPLDMIYTQRSRNLRKCAADIAADFNVLYADLYADKYENPFAKEPDRFCAQDHIHPSDEGYRLWYAKIKEVGEKAFSNIILSPLKKRG